MPEIKQLEGTIQELTKDSIKIQNYWIKFFDTKNLTGIKVGDNVGVSFVENKKDNRLYRNGKSIVKYEPRFNIDQEVQKVKLDTSTINTILMISKDILINQENLQIELIKLNKIKELTYVNYKEIVKEILEGLKEINKY